MKLNREECDRILVASSTKTAKELAEDYNVSVPTIYNVVRKKKPYNFPPNAAQASPAP